MVGFLLPEKEKFIQPLLKHLGLSYQLSDISYKLISSLIISDKKNVNSAVSYQPSAISPATYYITQMKEKLVSKEN